MTTRSDSASSRSMTASSGSYSTSIASTASWAAASLSGEHGGDAVAGVARLLLRQRVVRRVLHVLGDRPGARHRRGPRLGEVVAGVDGDDAGHSAAADVSMPTMRACAYGLRTTARCSARARRGRW